MNHAGCNADMGGERSGFPSDNGPWPQRVSLYKLLIS